ncbi:MAG: M20/M25/M40 family metallo-hydrolase [Anaerolineae bacterium]|nr:M20/M25/M40 family metallo-hydrolase [Anaerolineae bacterium]
MCAPGRERLLETFRELLRISSPSGKEEALARHLVAELEMMGLEVRRDGAGNVIARADGEGEPLLLCAHMDTVEPTEDLVIVEEDGCFRSDGTTILGADDKAGIATILEAIKRAGPRPPLDIVFTVHEEGGLLGAKALNLAELRARRGLVLDAGGSVGSVVTAAPSQVKLAARIHGVAAHAGSAPERGVNAIVLAARGITAMRLGRLDDETTANIGIIRGGQATNVVPDLVELRGEARSHSEEKLQRQVAAMKGALEQAATEGGGRAEVEVQRSYSGFSIPEDDPLVTTFLRVAERMGLEAATVKGGGGSDANVFNAQGMVCVNVSVGMGNSHAKDEYIRVDDLEQATGLLTELLRALSRLPERDSQ